MSGGHFDYAQFHITQISDEVEQLILTNGKIKKDEYGGWSGRDFSKKTIEEFKRGLLLLKQAAIYAQRIDWLVSGDDGEDDFHERLEEELSKL